jgi:hypothetical protein
MIELRESQTYGDEPESAQSSEDQLWADTLTDLNMPTAQLSDAVSDVIRDNPDILQAMLLAIGDPKDQESMDNESNRQIRQDLIAKFRELKQPER